MKRPCLPLPAVQAPTTKILPTKCLNIAEPRIFCPPKITRYTVSHHVNNCTIEDSQQNFDTIVQAALSGALFSIVYRLGLFSQFCF